MNDADRLLDGDLTEAELASLLARLREDSALRDAVTTAQLVRDAAGGRRALDRGYTLRILERLREHRTRPR